jgi:Protein of unknown function (DUF3011)
MFNTKRGTMVCAMALATCVITLAQTRITCSSNKGDRQYCDADTRNGVILFKQLSRDRCVQGRSWGFDRRGIWVDQGCSAVFALGPAGGRPGPDRPGYDRPGRPGPSYPSVQVITCESNNGKRQWCRQDDTSARVRLVKQRSESKCVEGYSWGTAPGSVWVDHGCRGDFEVRSGR